MGIRGIIRFAVCVTLLWPMAGFANEEAERVRNSFFGAGAPYYPGVLGVPAAEYDLIVRGYQQRARANAELQRIIYSGTNQERAELVRQIPELQLLLGIDRDGKLSRNGGFHAGFASELIGRVHPAHLARLYAPDIWRVRTPGTRQRFRLVVGEENGGNPGGSDRLRRLSQIFAGNPEYGNLPSNEGFHRRMFEHLKEIYQNYRPGAPTPVIVYLTEDSVRREPIRFRFQGQNYEMTPPNPKPKELIDSTREHFARNGVIWLSSVDPEDKRRIFVENNQLYVLRQSQGREVKVKVDVLYTRMDVEMSDSTYRKQVERNRLAGRADMTETGKLVGVPGLVEAWLANQNPRDPNRRGFLWVNGLTSMLTTNKIWPSLVDLYIERVNGERPQLPLLRTEYFVTRDGQFDREKFERIWAENTRYVVKQTLGQGGKQVEFPHEIIANPNGERELRAMKERMVEALLVNPFSYAMQERGELASLQLNFMGRLRNAVRLFHDYRLIGFISPGKQTMMRQIMIRLSRSLKINVSLGGSVAIGARASTERLEPLPAKTVSRPVRCGMAVSLLGL